MGNINIAPATPPAVVWVIEQHLGVDVCSTSFLATSSVSNRLVSNAVAVCAIPNWGLIKSESENAIPGGRPRIVGS